MSFLSAGRTRLFVFAQLVVATGVLSGTVIAEAKDARKRAPHPQPAPEADTLSSSSSFDNYEAPLELPKLTRENFDKVVLQMAPLKGIKDGVTRSASKPAQPATAAQPAADAAPAPATDAKAAEAKPVETKPAAPAAVAQGKPADVAKPDVARPDAAQTAAAAPEQAAGQPAPVAQAPAADAVPPQAPVAEPQSPVAAESAPAATAEAKQEPAPAPLAAATPQAADEAKPADAPMTAAAPAAPQEAATAEVATPEPAPAPQADAAGAAPSQAAPAPVAEAQPQPEAAAPAAEQAQAEARPAESWKDLIATGVNGPAEVRIADRATLWLTAGSVYLPAEAAQKLFAILDMPWEASTQGVVVKDAATAPWFSVIDLMDDGHVYVDDKAALDADKALELFKARVAAGAADRAAHSLAPYEVSGWVQEPALDEKHRLSSCVDVAPQGATGPQDGLVNCTGFSFGRSSVLKVSTVVAQADAAKAKGEAALLADAIIFDKGAAYDDVDPSTDKRADYAPTDLVGGSFAPQKMSSMGHLVKDVAQRPGVVVLLLYKAIAHWKMLASFIFGALLLAVAWKHRKPSQPRAVSAPARSLADEQPLDDEVVKPAGKATVTAAEKSSGLSAIVAAAQAKFATMRKPASEAVPAPEAPGEDALPREAKEAVVAVSRAATAKAATAKVALPKPAGGLGAAIASLRARLPGAAKPNAQPTQTVKPTSSAPDVSDALIDPDRPGTALKKLASVMRKKAPEAPPPAVDMSRLTRGRPLPGAAPEAAPVVAAPAAPAPVEEAAPARAAPAAPAPVVAAAEASPSTFDDLGLVEPPPAPNRRAVR